MTKRKKPYEAQYVFQVFRCENPECGCIHFNVTVDDEEFSVPIPDEIWNALMVDVAELQKGTVN